MLYPIVCPEGFEWLQPGKIGYFPLRTSPQSHVPKLLELGIRSIIVISDEKPELPNANANITTEHIGTNIFASVESHQCSQFLCRFLPPEVDPLVICFDDPDSHRDVALALILMARWNFTAAEAVEYLGLLGHSASDVHLDVIRASEARVQTLAAPVQKRKPEMASVLSPSKTPLVPSIGPLVPPAKNDHQ